MSNIKTIEERIRKLEERKQKSAQAFGEIIVEELDVSTPTEFKKFIREYSNNFNDVLHKWRQIEKDKADEKKRKQESKQNNQDDYFSE